MTTYQRLISTIESEFFFLAGSHQLFSCFPDSQKLRCNFEALGYIKRHRAVSYATGDVIYTKHIHWSQTERTFSEQKLIKSNSSTTVVDRLLYKQMFFLLRK